MNEGLKVCRYRVEKTGYGFWPYCVRAGDGTRELFRGHKKQCVVVAAELETAFEDGKFVSTCAAPQHDAELVELLRDKFPRVDPCKPLPLDEKAHCCEYTIYVERERLHRLIDATMSAKP